jgi:AraC-like DNA-binding protein
MAFCTELFMRYGSHNSLNPIGISSLHKDFSDIKARFHDEMHLSFGLEELSTSVGLSKFQFLRQFKSATGMTPHAYLKRVRLEYAKRALAKGSTVTDIAHKVGFFDQSHFNKAFKNAFLITPSHFQKQVK